MDTDFFKACEKNKVNVVKQLIEKGYDVNQTTTDYNDWLNGVVTPLDVAVFYGNYDVVAQLIESGTEYDSGIYKNALPDFLGLIKHRKPTFFYKVLNNDGIRVSLSDEELENLHYEAYMLNNPTLYKRLCEKLPFTFNKQRGSEVIAKLLQSTEFTIDMKAESTRKRESKNSVRLTKMMVEKTGLDMWVVKKDNNYQKLLKIA